MSEEKEKFHYTYSASQQEEISKIRNKYLTDTAAGEVDKMEQLRQLDAAVTRKATVPSLTLGIIGAMVMGTGMSLIMTNIGEYLGLVSTLIPGIVIGLVGMVGVIFAYPLYHCILKRQRKKAAPQILKLTEELSDK